MGRGPHRQVTAQIAGSTFAEDTQDQDDADGSGVHTFAANVDALDLWKVDADETATVVANGLTIIVPAGVQYLEPTRFAGTPSGEVTITGLTDYYVNRYE